MIKIAIALFAFFFLHSLLADNSVKDFLQKKFISPRWYRIVYNVLAILTVLPVYYLYRQAPSEYLFDLPSWFQRLANVGVFLSIILLYYSFRKYDWGEFSGIGYLKAKDKSITPSLQTKGMNSHVRHPLYFASLLLFWFSFLSSPSIPILVVAIMGSLYLYIGTRLEEQKLIDTFGEEYRQYQKRVPMLLPKLWKPKS